MAQVDTLPLPDMLSTGTIPTCVVCKVPVRYRVKDKNQKHENEVKITKYRRILTALYEVLPTAAV
jgi:hypothetical protein